MPSSMAIATGRGRYREASRLAAKAAALCKVSRRVMVNTNNWQGAMQGNGADAEGRGAQAAAGWPGRTFWKWNVVVLLALIVLVQAPLWLRGFGEQAVGEVVDAYVLKPRGGRGMAVPSVALVFRYPWRGRSYTATELYDPRESWSKNWGETEYAAASAFIAEHPKGRAITVWVPRFVHWEASVVPAVTSESVRHIGRWAVTIAVIGTYGLLLVFGVATFRQIRQWRKRRSLRSGG